MEHCYYQYSSSSSFGGKEKRPPLKRGQLKRQIVRKLSNLVVPRSDADQKKRAESGSFRREASCN